MKVFGRGRGAWLVMALVGLFAAGAPLQAQSGTVSGRVVSEQGEPVEGAQVQLRSARGTRGTVTDAAGRYAVTLPAAGSYRVRVQAIGHRAAEREVSVAAGGTSTLDFTLETAPVALSGMVVSATRSSTPVVAVAGAVSVVGREQIEEQARLTQNLGDLLAQVVPGLGAGMQTNSIYGQSLRGRGVAVLIDGVPQSTTRNVSRDLSTIDPAVIERVEVLRGATSVYGDGATGGVINIVTRAPEAGRTRFTTSVGTETSLSRRGEGLGGRITQAVSGTQGSVDYALSGSFTRTGDYYDAAGDLIPSDPHGQGGLAETTGHDLFAKVGLNVGARRLQFSLNRFDSEQETEYVSDPSLDRLPAGTEKARPLAGLRLAENQGTRNTVASLDLTDPDVLGSRVHAQAFYRDYHTVFRPFDGRKWASTGHSIIQSWLESEKVGARATVETPLSFGGEPTLVWGADIIRETTAQPVYVFDPAAYDRSGGLAFRTTGERSWVPEMAPRSIGLFAQFSARPVERILLRGGVRRERARMRIDDFTTLAGNQVTGGELEFDPTLLNVGAVVDVTRAVNLYASFSQGFSLADVGLYLRSAAEDYVVGNKKLEAQEVDQYEVGVRGAWSGVQASLATFRNESDLGTTSAGFDMAVVRAPERVYGIEATLDVQPVRTLSLGGTFGWVEGEYFLERTGSWHALNGWRIQPLKLTAHAEHETLPGWNNRLQLLHSGGRDRAFQERPSLERVGFGERAVEEYTVVDWLSSVALGPGVLSVGLQNLLNEQYFPVVSQLMRTGGNSSYAAGRGRTLSVGYTVSY
jgi:iron complex outermembrane receptor protein